MLKGGSAQTGAAPSRLRSTFLGIQAAASVMLLVLAAILARMLIEAVPWRLGFDSGRLIVMHAFVPGGRDGNVPENQFWDLALSRVRGLPGVERAALAEDLPYSSGFHPLTASLDGRRYPLVQNKISPRVLRNDRLPDSPRPDVHS